MNAESEWVRSSRRNLTYVDLISTQTGGADHEALRCWVGSALFWLVATDNLLRNVDGELPAGGRYPDRRNLDVGGRTLEGLRVARNEMAHGADLIVSSLGLVFPLFVDRSMDFGGRWVTAAALRESHRRRDRQPSEGALELYREYVSERPPWEPIELTYQWLGSLLEPSS